ncbi:hypothetical protein [Roseomonas xinghualingensis]|uniref:hypothetical protein n=1 Tax=Roseomonas xinghualingensis TaxID=2986475 RepID=UPI0021F1FCC2|nr:hypothetical protein [Roseomonas sp. SXEYE001]MCV4210282.1 hypothetical protein [Roseomonas sp. SXEYE001]
MCKCIEEVNAFLAPYNTELVIEIFRGTIVVETQKKENRVRGRAKAMLPTFCPFCGEKYPERALARATGEERS